MNKTTIYNWETHRSAPQVHHLPRVIDFLAYNPLPLPQTFAQRLLATRRALGLTQKDMASRIEVDPTTLARWESGKNHPSNKLTQKLKRLLQLPDSLPDK